MSQKKAVLSYLTTGAGITSQYAFSHMGLTRISAVIYNLINDGYNIERVDVPVNNRHGRSVKIGRWFLREGDRAIQKELDL